jgi:hypothetical protein
MRALWLVALVLVFFSAAADAGNGMQNARGSSAAHSSPSGHVSGARPVSWSRMGNAHSNPGWQGAQPHYPSPRYGYAQPYLAPYYAQPGYADPGYEDSGYDGADESPGYVQAQYQQPQDEAPAPPIAPSIQAAVAFVVQYVTSGQQQPVNVSPDARVTKGTLYKYTRNGVNSYTNMPPADDVGAKTLFSYTEVDTPLAGKNLYRCVDGKSQNVNYSSAPVASLYCKAVNNGAHAAN